MQIIITCEEIFLTHELELSLRRVRLRRSTGRGKHTLIMVYIQCQILYNVSAKLPRYDGEEDKVEKGAMKKDVLGHKSSASEA